MKYIFIASAMGVGNFIYQAIFEETPSYSLAFERSFFQSSALFAVWVLENFAE